MNLLDFERVTDQAFSFLTAEYAYDALPAERGGKFGSACIRRFVRGSYEVGLGFGDVDSHHLCDVWFRDDLGQNVVERSYMERSLLVLLAKRYPKFVHPTRADLSNETAAESTISQYAQLVRDYALDVVKGDFSAFPALIYVLHHVDHQFTGRPVRRLLGVYSTYELATAAIHDREVKKGYCQRADGFEIWRVQIDGYGFWFAGIPLGESRDNHG